MDEVTSVQDRIRPMPGLISCAGVTGSGRITYHTYVTLLSGLSSFLVAFYFLQGSPSPCNLQNKLPLLRMPNSNIRSVAFHCRGNTMATHYQHGVTNKNTAHNKACTQMYAVCNVLYAVRPSTILYVCTNVLCVCVHEF